MCTRRNIQMATKMNEILRDNKPGEKAFFAVGAAHWQIGEHSMEKFLKLYGYSLVRVESYGKDDAENMTNEQCGVVFDYEKNRFVPLDEASGHTPPTPPNITWAIPSIPLKSNQKRIPRQLRGGRSE